MCAWFLCTIRWWPQQWLSQLCTGRSQGKKRAKKNQRGKSRTGCESERYSPLLLYPQNRAAQSPSSSPLWRKRSSCSVGEAQAPHWQAESHSSELHRHLITAAFQPKSHQKQQGWRGRSDRGMVQISRGKTASLGCDPGNEAGWRQRTWCMVGTAV